MTSALAKVAGRYPGFRENEPLANHVQYRVGGMAEGYLELSPGADLRSLLASCARQEIPVTPIGAGSNCLISDLGLPGLAVKLSGKDWRLDRNRGLVTVTGGAMMPRLALDVAKAGFSGLEFGIGIPGTVGASVFGNAGAFGGEIASCLVSCVVEDGSGERTVLAAECGFGYRHSSFKEGELSGFIVEATFAVTHADAASVQERTKAFAGERKLSQPYGLKSLGSTFTNPPGDFAGRLLEKAGMKGERVGGAMVSDKHANFIINIDHASATDVARLVTIMHDRVFNELGVDLEPEIIFLGEFTEVGPWNASLHRIAEG